MMVFLSVFITGTFVGGGHCKTRHISDIFDSWVNSEISEHAVKSSAIVQCISSLSYRRKTLQNILVLIIEYHAIISTLPTAVSFYKS
jgi:hypothetical protein